MDDLSRVVEALSDAHRVLIAGHIDPDPDCVGSTLALHWLLQKMGKTSQPISHDPMLSQWSFLPYIDDVVSPDDPAVKDRPWDTLVIVDCELERSGDAARLQSIVDRVINIDHHVTNAGSGHINFIRPEAAATGELIYAIISSLGVPLDAKVSTLLFAAIMSDTGSFKYANTTSTSLDIAAKLVGHGAEPSVISGHIYETRSEGYLRLLGLVLNSLKRSDDGRIAWIELTQSMIEEAGARQNETDGFVQYPRMISNVDIAIFFHELPDDYVRVSLRSGKHFDVSVLAKQFGGGGHKKAAGCKIAGSIDDVKYRVVAAAKRLIAAGSHESH